MAEMLPVSAETTILQRTKTGFCILHLSRHCRYGTVVVAAAAATAAVVVEAEPGGTPGGPRLRHLLRRCQWTGGTGEGERETELTATIETTAMPEVTAAVAGTTAPASAVITAAVAGCWEQD